MTCRALWPRRRPFPCTPGSPGSGERRLDASHELATVGNAVDLGVLTWSNSIGAGELTAAWKDPDFDAALPAFYDLRVLEIPTPPWVAYDATHFDFKRRGSLELITEESAYSSPVWYTPWHQSRDDTIGRISWALPGRITDQPGGGRRPGPVAGSGVGWGRATGCRGYGRMG